MRIVRGRGNARRLLIDVPDGSLVKRSPLAEQSLLTKLVCDMVGVTAFGAGHNSVQIPHDGVLS